MATSTGWASSDGRSGAWKLGTSKDSVARRCVDLLACLDNEMMRAPFDVLAMEALVAYGHEGARAMGLLVLARYVGCVEMWACKRSLRLVAYSPAEIKKYATGKGNATKQDMAAAAKREGFKSKQPDEVDAWWCLRLAQYRLRLGMD